jgi:hypothetical protein
MMMSLTSEQLRSEVDYDPETGVFTRITERGGCAVGSVAGWRGKKGYQHLNVLGRKYAAHRLAWLHVYGEWPTGALDHINRDKTDNRISNLRIATPAENQRNIGVRKSNTSGVVGVYWFARTGKWMAAVFLGGKNIHLGYFENKDDAIAARQKAAELVYGGDYAP